MTRDRPPFAHALCALLSAQVPDLSRLASQAFLALCFALGLALVFFCFLRDGPLRSPPTSASVMSSAGAGPPFEHATDARTHLRIEIQRLEALRAEGESGCLLL